MRHMTMPARLLNGMTSLYVRVGCWACRSAVGHSATLCSGALNAEDAAQLLMAASPSKYDARLPTHTGGFVAVSAVRNQGSCWACTSFALTAAAEAAVASALGKDARQKQFSVQEFHFCRQAGSSGRMTRSCYSPVNLKEGLDILLSMGHDKGFVVIDSCLPYNPLPTASVTEDSRQVGMRVRLSIIIIIIVIIIIIIIIDPCL